MTKTETPKCVTCTLRHSDEQPCPPPTPAIARGDAALWPWYAPTGYEAERRAVTAYVADALLDVDEMARAMVQGIHGDGWWDSNDPVAENVRENSRVRARAIRAALLGVQPAGDRA